jgi:hypothetical protein
MEPNEIPPILDDFEDEELQEPTTALVPLNSAASWQQITNALVERLEGEDLPERVIKATEYLVCGWPMYKVAQRVKSKEKTIRGWLKRYPAMALAVAEGQKALHLWRLSQLEQQFLTAMEVSQELFDSIEGEWVEIATDEGIENEWRPTNHKLLAAKATHARFIIGLFAGQKLKIDIQTPEEERPPLKAGIDALDYLIEGISDRIDDHRAKPIEKIIRVIDTTSGEDIPYVDEKGDPFFGIMGELDMAEDGTLCHICGKRARHIRQHIGGAHKMAPFDYEVTFMLDEGALYRADTK